jgi:hypothetical protein
MPYIATRNAAITLKTLGKIKKKSQDQKKQSNMFKKKPKMGKGACNSNVSKYDPVGAMTIDELEMLIREHQTIMLVNEGGHLHMRRSSEMDKACKQYWDITKDKEYLSCQQVVCEVRKARGGLKLTAEYLQFLFLKVWLRLFFLGFVIGVLMDTGHEMQARCPEDTGHVAHAGRA